MSWLALFALAASLAFAALALTMSKPRRAKKRPRAAPIEPVEREVAREPQPAATTPEASWRAGVVLMDEADDYPTATFDLFRIEFAARTDVGKKRRSNEDRYLCVPDAPLLVVADGMGGEVGGEIASSIAVGEVGAAFSGSREERAWPVDVDAGLSTGGQLLMDAICRANDGIRKRVRDDPDLRGMGTTIVAMYFVARKNRIYVAHVGDSRAYRVRDGVIERLTNDHTLASITGVKGGVGDRLAWALGAADQMTIDIRAVTPKLGDRLLLCSDGLSKPVSDEEIASIVAGEKDLEQCVERLVALANERGGPDNITAIVAEVVSPGARADAPA